MGIALVMPDGRPIRCNSALERMLGYSSEEIAAMSFAQFTHPDDVERERQQFQEVMEKDLNFYQGEMRYRRKDGATVWGSLTVSIVRGEDGKMAYGVRMLEDVSEQKSAELALRESEAARQHLQDQLIVAQKLEAVGQLAGGVAHDFNNILAAIMLHLDLLKSESAISPGRLDSIDELIMASRRAAGLTRQLLLFSRREPAQRRVVDLNVIVSNLLKMLDRLVGEHLTLVHEATPQALWLLADPGMLEQVVMNLVVNARDAMPGGGRIVLRAEAIAIDAVHAARQRGGRAGPFIRLAVIDKGGGMSADTQARIFEPFFTTKEAGKGTGLGLSTVFGIVQQHAGWIEVESAEGMGSSFAIYLPAHTGPVVDQIPERAAVPVAKGYETILIAEDNEGLRLAAVKILRRSGYDVLEAADGRSARAILDARPGEVDLLLTDVVMPGGLMGHELAAGLRTAGSPKVILMSGYTTNVDRGHARSGQVTSTCAKLLRVPANPCRSSARPWAAGRRKRRLLPRDKAAFSRRRTAPPRSHETFVVFPLVGRGDGVSPRSGRRRNVRLRPLQDQSPHCRWLQQPRLETHDAVDPGRPGAHRVVHDCRLDLARQRQRDGLGGLAACLRVTTVTS